MSGRVLVWAQAPPLRRAGKLTVVIDGAQVGQVKQGEVAPFTVEPGMHTVRVGVGSGRSNTVTVNVADGGTSRVANYSTGLSWVAAMIPLLGLVLVQIPGLIFRLQVQAPQPEPAQPTQPAQEPAREAPAEGSVSSGSTGLWWESDPVLSKRYRPTAPPGDGK